MKTPKSVLAWAAHDQGWLYLQSIRHARESVEDWIGMGGSSFAKAVRVRITVVRERKRKQAKKATKRRAKR